MNKNTIDVYDTYNTIFIKLIENKIKPLTKTKFNLISRLRMSTLYAVSQSINGGRVISTINACKKFVGYGTLWGDIVGDFAPLSNLVISEIKMIGKDLGLPVELINKISLNEKILGVSYNDIEKYCKAYYSKNPYQERIFYEMKDNMKKETYEKIRILHDKCYFKRNMIDIPKIEL